MQYWSDDAIFEVKCPDCSKMVEFYKDDTTRKCHHCGHRFVNPKMDFGCATYCQFAEQCLGTLPEEFVMQQDNLLKDKVAVEMKRYFKSDFKNIGHSIRLARHAEKIAKATENANLAVILCSAYLMNIGYSKASQKKPTVTDRDLQREGPAVASAILQKLKANDSLIMQVTDIIGNTRRETSDYSIEMDIVLDANHLIQMEEEDKEACLTKDRIEEHLQQFLSEKGREAARILFTERQRLNPGFKGFPAP
jgi:HD superfamily phosphodiesterase